MTVKTRRRMFLGVLVLALTVPAESVLLNALQTPTDKAAAQQWVDSLDVVELDAVADRVQSYPFVYRREIMRGLAPGRRAQVWRDHIATYID